VSGFDKFAWLRAIRDDEELSDGEKYVLQNVALWYLKNGQDVVHVRQATAAELLKVSIRLVQKAYAAARRLGYFALQAGRERGRGGKSDSYRLAIPVPAQCAPTTGSTRTDCQKYPHETTEVPARAEAPTSANDTPYRVLKGFNKGYGAAGPAPGGPTVHRRPRSDTKALGDIFERVGPLRSDAPKPSAEPALGRMAQEAIEASRKNLDRAEQQARNEEIA
jgi:hypothetical protein